LKNKSNINPHPAARKLKKPNPSGLKSQGPSFWKFPKWLLAAVLYGMSWSHFTGINLSFLAWFAFVPLFIDLENRNSFRAFYSRALLFSVIAYFIICHGFLFTARTVAMFFVGAADELFLTSISFALVYPFKKRYGFKTALILFPFVISLWEWLYQQLEHTTGYLMLSNSQCQNAPLIQYIDVFGVWSIAFWVMAFNVLLFLHYQKRVSDPKSRAVKNGFAVICLLMIVPPLCYFSFKQSRNREKTGESVRFTLIHTRFPLAADSPDSWAERIERLTFLTDSADYELKADRLRSDLYVWHEGAIERGNDRHVTAFLDSAVGDWGPPLLTGMNCIPGNAAKDDRRRVNRAVLFGVPSRQTASDQYYDKVRLFPVREQIPYHGLLAKLPFFTVPLTDPRFLKKGGAIRTIEVDAQNRKKIRIGTPICQEQNYPAVWSGMALAGAACFVQLSSESWWTLEYFKRQMADITRLRCIETGRSAARCSNAGVTAFIDALGRVYSQAGTKEGALTDELDLSGDGTTFFSRHQRLFPALCLGMAIVVALYSESERIRKKRHSGVPHG
jgi:apolipoprotein N-acyltransferase